MHTDIFTYILDAIKDVLNILNVFKDVLICLSVSHIQISLNK